MKDKPFDTDEKKEKAYKLLNSFETGADLYRAIKKEFGSGRHLDLRLYPKTSISENQVRTYRSDPATITWQSLPLLDLPFNGRLIALAGDIPEREWNVFADRQWVTDLLQHLVLAFLKLQPSDQEALVSVAQTMSRAIRVTPDTFEIHADACKGIEDDFIEWQGMTETDALDVDRDNLYNTTQELCYDQFRHIDGRQEEEGERQAALDRLNRTRLTQL